MLDLVTILKLLTEQTKFVVDPITNRWQIQRCQRIKEAGCQAAQAAITKSHIGLFVCDHIKVLAKLAQCITSLLKQTRIV